MNANDGAPDYDVAICGAGPVGMTAAALLNKRGLTVVVLEKNSRTSDEPKAISLDDESLRAYQQAGIVDAVLGIVVPGTGTRYYDSDNQPLFDAGAPVACRFGYPFKNPFAQPELERVLLEALTAKTGVDVLFGTEVTAIAEQGSSVTLTANGREFHARYLLGCDGGRSTVRSLLGVTMTGRTHSDTWLVVDTAGDPHTERYGMHHADPERPHVIVPGLDGRCRYEFRLFDGEGEPSTEPPFELIERLVSRYRPIAPEQVVRAVNYRFHGLVADQWQVGRCFLLGDAAHMMPPFAGQGLNSGIRDAVNLAWKMAAVVAGTLVEGVLTSYESERRPHATATVRSSERLGRVVMTTSTRFARRRDELIGAALDTVEGREYFEQMRFRPPQRYDVGLVVPGGKQVGVPFGQPRVFDTASRSIHLLDQSFANGWAVIGVDVADRRAWSSAGVVADLLGAQCFSVFTDASIARGVPPTLIDVDGGLDLELRAYVGRFVLLRPDHFVASAWLPGETVAVADHVRTWTSTEGQPADLQPTFTTQSKGILP